MTKTKEKRRSAWDALEHLIDFADAACLAMDEEDAEDTETRRVVDEHEAKQRAERVAWARLISERNRGGK